MLPVISIPQNILSSGYKKGEVHTSPILSAYSSTSMYVDVLKLNRFTVLVILLPTYQASPTTMNIEYSGISAIISSFLNFIIIPPSGFFNEKPNSIICRCFTKIIYHLIYGKYGYKRNRYDSFLYSLMNVWTASADSPYSSRNESNDSFNSLIESIPRFLIFCKSSSDFSKTAYNVVTPHL